MKKKWTHKELDQMIDNILKRLEFPLDIPLLYEKFELGTLRIDFKYKKEELSLNKKFKKAGYLQGSLFDLKGLLSFFKRNLETEFKLTQKYEAEINKSSALLSILLMSCPDKALTILYRELPKTNLGRIIYAKEAGLFELIKAEGPIILCNPDAYSMLTKLTSNKDIAKLKIDKLRDSLLVFAYDKPLERIPQSPKGRHVADLAHLVGKDSIEKAYSLLRYLLRDIKANYKNQRINDSNEIFEKQGVAFFNQLIEFIQDESPDFANYIKKFTYYKNPFIFISTFINDDKYLREEFLKFEWEPNKFAKKLFAKLLDISESKLEKIVYS